MATVDKPSARETKRLQTRERLMGAAIAEFKRGGMARCRRRRRSLRPPESHTAPSSFISRPRNMCCLELERREEERIAKQLDRFADAAHDLPSILREAVRLVLGLERRLVRVSSKTFWLCTSHRPVPRTKAKSIPSSCGSPKRSSEPERLGHVAPEVVPVNSAVFFLLGLYALLTTTHDWPYAERDARRLRGQHAAQS